MSKHIAFCESELTFPLSVCLSHRADPEEDSRSGPQLLGKSKVQ